ncbi:DUF885 domain-containing protein [Sphingosinicella sp. BN140058]|uniref:DUF885 domain-containing protein n=1 Tax=Sphingosinicella sp. BN140058 TaxID=1892855 RepID=UPI0010127925|nr:DUF885 domain-containing protein [Sphingosinicella sp. BN140058]QAY80036.1 DUF885 domain-containing protein [Sphingosinicella sp. BN140058]
MAARLARLLLSAVALTAGGCATAPSEPAAAAQPLPSRWSAFSQSFIDGYFRHNPAFAVSQGRHEYDGRLPDWSGTGLAASIAFLHGSIETAERFDPATLTDEERFERAYLIARAKGDLFWLSTADQPHRNPTYYVDAMGPAVYVTRNYAPAETRLRAYIAYLKAIPAAARNIRANLKTPLPLSFIEYGKAGFGGYAEYFPTDGKAAFASVQDAKLQADLDRATRDAVTATRGLADWLEAQRANATEDFALGANRFAQMLRDTEMVDLPLDQLEAIGRADLDRNQRALRNACGTYAPGATMAACMAKMNADKPAGGAVKGARDQLAGLKRFIEDKNLVSIPGTEEAQVEEAPPYNRQNFAYIDIPGPYESGLPSTYYIAPPDPSWPNDVQDGFVPGKADLLFTSVHEVWPGHFLNFLHANRSRFTFGKVFVGYAYAEGWGHYSEEMMWEAGLGNGAPEIHIGQISNALLRDCRFLSAIGMHTGRMTMEQSRQLFLDQCYQDEGNARQQAARGTYDPAYLNYTMGKLMIRKLRDDWTRSHGGRSAWKDFHDRFLSYGGPPLPLVRAQMMGGDPDAVF